MSATTSAPTALTRQRVLTGAVALRDTTLIAIPRATMAAVVQRNPQLARMLGETIDIRRKAAEEWRTATTERGRRFPEVSSVATQH